MNALAQSLLRTASDRLPRLTGRGKTGMEALFVAALPAEKTLSAMWVRRRIGELAAAFHRTAPTLMILVLNFFR
ncbi:MAG TPA: hypothetical protein VMH04_13910 [Candidatus Solibacter sp.]|nr:hypothetical protein [Candidatus Solibacter sp.]